MTSSLASSLFISAYVSHYCKCSKSQVNFAKVRDVANGNTITVEIVRDDARTYKTNSGLSTIVPLLNI